MDFGCGPGYFALPMAQLAGESGKVIAVDIQEEMLSILRTRAEDAGLSNRIRIHRSRPDSLAIADPVPVAFALAYHVLHEAGNQERILGEIAGLLKKDGLLLIAEPRYVVNQSEFKVTVGNAVQAGLIEGGSPRIWLSRTALLRKS
jgi:ubiquinone/menaquinone biosynthesis C-methylase UbiE